MSQLSEHFSEEEFLRSETAKKHKINNSWDKPKHKDNAIYLCKNYLEGYRIVLGAINVSSGYRCFLLNKHREIGGAINSAHCFGLAVDMIFTKYNIWDSFDKIIEILKEKKLDWDQLIFEEKLINGKIIRWVHFGLSSQATQRKQILHRNIKGQYLPITKAPR
jgi:hypothetical protein